ncbi:MAG: carboxypeptidase-like regulatory domain-containing protein, partial [Eudoraea sp.]|uniref:carboxypeptidase-like regulatory domain-containing protein n=2 Tax=Eudoraea sp. TaxID=1979955 RepID=UPI003C784220
MKLLPLSVFKKTSPLTVALCLVLMVGIQENLKAAFFQDTPTNVQTEFNQYKGEVIDQDNKNPLIFATLTLEGSNISTVTNTEGSFILKIPKNITSGNILISFLGYKTASIPLSQLKNEGNTIYLSVSVTELSEVDIVIPRNATNLVKETFRRRGDNYFDDATLMTAFYRETIKKRKQNVSLSEAVVNIYKTPYNNSKRDAVQLYKARKSTDYSKLDTLALKLQGGPFNALYVDMIKYPEYIFTERSIDDYNFNFVRSTRINDQTIFVISFKQKPEIMEPLFQGEL